MGDVVGALETAVLVGSAETNARDFQSVELVESTGPGDSFITSGMNIRVFLKRTKQQKE